MPAYMGAKWGAAANGVGATVTWSFAESNFATLPGQFGGYAAFDSPVATTYRTSVMAAFDAWETVANIDFVLVADSADVGIRVGDRYIDGPMGAGQTSSVLAQAQFWSGGGAIRTAQLYFDVDAYTASFYYIVLHEIGHTIGIGHAADPNSVMYYAMSGQNTDAGLTADDVLAAQTLYGARSGAPNVPPTTAPAANVSIAPVELSAAEGDTGVRLLSFEIRRTGDTAGAATVTWSVESPRANGVSASDFAAGVLPSGSVAFAAGETVRVVSLQVRGETLYETDESFTVRLTQATGAQIVTAGAHGAILNDDAKPTVSLRTGRIEVTEGAAGASLARIEVARSQAAEAATTVTYAVTPEGPAPVSAGDFVDGVLPSGAITFAAGETSRWIELPVRGDTDVEADEGFRLTLSSPDGAPLGLRELRGLVLNDDIRGPVYGGFGADTLRGGAGDDRLQGFAGDDRLEGGAGLDAAVYEGAASAYGWWSNTDGSWTVQDLRLYTPEGRDSLIGVEQLVFADRTVKLSGLTAAEQIGQAYENILRLPASSADVASAQPGLTMDLAALLKLADATTSVATLTYQFFTGRAPTKGGLDYLVSPTGPNPHNINSDYYQGFSLENRYINFAVNLGKLGEGRAAFEARYGGLSLVEATRAAYAEIFGAAPSDSKLDALLTPTFELGGVVLSRSAYFAYYGQDGDNGLGTKAAMVGWLLAEGAKADVGVYARANDAFLTDLADGAQLGINLVGVYGSPEHVI